MGSYPLYLLFCFLAHPSLYPLHPGGQLANVACHQRSVPLVCRLTNGHGEGHHSRDPFTHAPSQSDRSIARPNPPTLSGIWFPLVHHAAVTVPLATSTEDTALVHSKINYSIKEQLEKLQLEKLKPSMALG